MAITTLNCHDSLPSTTNQSPYNEICQRVVRTGACKVLHKARDAPTVSTLVLDNAMLHGYSIPGDKVTKWYMKTDHYVIISMLALS